MSTTARPPRPSLLKRIRNRFKRKAHTDTKAEEKKQALPLVSFNEALLEEYAWHSPADARRAREAEALRKQAGEKTADKKTEDEMRTRAFFTMLVRTQREAAGAEFDALKVKYREYFSGDEELAERAAIDDTFGLVGDEYERQRVKRENSEAAGDPSVNTNQSPAERSKARKEREDALRRKALDEWKQAREVKPPRKNGTGGNGSPGTPPTVPPSGGSPGGGVMSSGGGTAGFVGGGPSPTGGNGGVAGGNGGAGGEGNGGAGGGLFGTAREAREARGRAQRSALCLSGGGIRSATFNLGILQGLARHGLLEQFDYLSTVSGGGFIGGWLTAWLHRQSDPEMIDAVAGDEYAGTVSDVQRVVAQLKHKPVSPLEPEPAQIKHLRVFSNYLSPQTGLLSADTWTLVSTLVRNLLLTWLVFIPFLLVVLLVPRVWVAFLGNMPRESSAVLFWSKWVVGMPCAWLALFFVGLALSWPDGLRPRKKRVPSDKSLHRSREWPFLVFCLLPGVVAAVAFATYWKTLNLTANKTYPLSAFLEFAFLLLLVPWGLTALIHLLLIFRKGKRSDDRTKKRKVVTRLVLASLVIALAQLVTGCLLYALSQTLYGVIGVNDVVYATLSVPVIISALGLDCILIAGFTSTLVEDDAMEWWARAGAWFMIAVVGWAAVHALVLFAPELVLTLGHTLGEASQADFWTEKKLKAAGQVFAVLGGVASLVITLAGGFSAKTPAHGKEAEAAGAGTRLLGVLAGLLGPVALAFILGLLAVGTNYLLKGFGSLLLWDGWPALGSWLPDRLAAWRPATGLLSWMREGLAEFVNLNPGEHASFLVKTPLQLLAFAAAAVGMAGFVMGLLINSNKFSLHYMWRNRIVRAYLGASNRSRCPESFTNFDPGDNIKMHELRPDTHPGNSGHGNGAGAAGNEKGVVAPEKVAPEEHAMRRKLFHVLNVALNLAGGDNLAWQDRKAESFTISKLHCGSYWLGYRHSSVYGGDEGISLGTAVAISGAFVSPNMGYMMTSPVVRFLMTLFNVRFGWWLGNPGLAGDKTPPLEWLTSFHRLLGRASASPFEASSPVLSVLPIVAEAFGKTNDRSSYVYLSDGGHFENLGLYEMVLRRCRFIVVSDASTDAGYSFDSLGQSIRQIRVDLGVPIDITDMSIIAPSDDLRGKYCAVGRIRYSCVDRDAENPEHDGLRDEDFDGTLIYIKASMIGDEPRDVVNYGRGSGSFPQEVIVDQWFSEAQFESYRALGSHIIDTLCSAGLGHTSDSNTVGLPEFEAKARRHNQLNFRVFKERASYAALVEEFRRLLRREELPEYRSRVKDYFKTLVG
jgi:hypothetical protein